MLWLLFLALIYAATQMYKANKLCIRWVGGLLFARFYLTLAQIRRAAVIESKC